MKNFRKIARKYIWKNSGANLESFKKECESLEKMRHPNILMYYGFTENQQEYIIKMEYCENGCLKKGEFINSRENFI